jgi:hypothetical protein
MMLQNRRANSSGCRKGHFPDKKCSWKAKTETIKQEIIKTQKNISSKKFTIDVQKQRLLMHKCS